LRFRLVLSLLIFFTVLLLVLGFVIREQLTTITRSQASELLEEEWAASKGYLRIENQYPKWYYDRFDPEEAIIVNRIESGVYMFADALGNVVEISTPAKTLGMNSRAEILNRIKEAQASPLQPLLEVRTNDRGVPYMLRYGIIPDPQHRVYLLLIGRSLADSMRTVDRFTIRYFAVVPLMLIVCAILGWLVAGRALIPVTEVAAAAQKITGSNLNVSIPLRGAGDELDHLVETFNGMVSRLNQSFQQTRQFSTDVSHELRTPLTAIRGQLEVALFTAETPDQFRDAMANALQDVEQLSNIVRALLMLSQAESGQIVLQLAPVNLAGVVRDIVDQFQIPAEESKISLTPEVPEDLTIRADKIQMERLVSNLISNALKYTPAGGSIRVGLQRSADSAMLRVEDNGIGIPPAKLPHIFDRFYRVRPSQSNPVQGLGLGLSFVSWIVNAHGGHIEVDSSEGRGTTFTVTLPTGGAPHPETSRLPMPDHAKL
jgi:heavy metal sensor kinase